MKSIRQSAGFPENMPAGVPGPQATANTVRRLPATGPQEVFFHLDFVRSLQMHRKMALGILLTFVLLSLGYMAKRWNTYRADALVYVQPSPHRVIENGPAQQWPYDANTYESYIQQQVHDVTRPDVLAGAVKHLTGWQGSGESEQAAADRLGSAVEVTRLGSAYEVQIESTATSAEEAARIANAVAASYIESATREQRAGDPERIALLREERDTLEKELESDRVEQEDLSRKLGVAAVTGSTPDPIDDQIAQTRAELVKARTASDQAAAKLTSLVGTGTSNVALDAEAEELVAADPGLVSMKTALNKRRSELITQVANLTPNHPQYKQDAEELAKINASLETMTRELRAKAETEIQQKLKNELERTSSVEARLNGQLGQLTGTAVTAAPRMQRLNELGSDIQRLRNRFTVVDEQYRNLTMEDSSPGAVYLASAALPSLHAARARVVRNGLIVMLAGLVIAIGSALLAHNLDKRVYIAQDVERVLGFPPMAQIPDMFEAGTGVAEEYMLRLAAAVEHAHQQGLLNSCIFTGISAGAGVTTVSSRVSTMLQAMGRETVLVDAVGAPQGSLGEPQSAPGTELMHAPRGSRSTALLQQMNEETAGDSVVVTDTAPLLVSGETEYLARFVDSAIVVIESGVTTKAQLREVAQTLQRLEVSSVGFVLNRISLKNASPAFRESVRAVETHLRSQAAQADKTASRKEAPFETAPVEQASEPQVNSQAFQSVWHSAPKPAQETAVARENLADAQTWKAVEPPAYAPAAAAAVAEAPAMASPEIAVVAETSVEQTEQKESASTERWGLPEYTRAAEVTVMEPAAPPAAVPEPQEKRPAARVWTSGSVARPMRGREVARSISAAESRTAAQSPSSPVPAAQAPDAQPESELVQTPVTEPNSDVVERTANEPSEKPRATVTRFEDLAAAAASRHTGWAELRSQAAQMHPPSQAGAYAASAYQSIAPMPAQEPAAETVVAHAPDAESELVTSSATRLGGLRTLMTSLGIKNLHKEMELRKTHPEPQSIVERPVERPVERFVFAQPVTPSVSPSGRVNTPATEVIALPEIIPPHAALEHAEREADLTRPVKSPRVSSWDTADDVEILPSKRGQYRKRG